jgi:hypothetical protein
MALEGDATFGTENLSDGLIRATHCNQRATDKNHKIQCLTESATPAPAAEPAVAVAVPARIADPCRQAYRHAYRRACRRPAPPTAAAAASYRRGFAALGCGIAGCGGGAGSL